MHLYLAHKSTAQWGGHGHVQISCRGRYWTEFNQINFVKCILNTVQRISYTAASTHYNRHMYTKLL